MREVPALIDARITGELAGAVTRRANWGLPGAAADYAERVLGPLLRTTDPGTTLRHERGLDEATVAATGLVPMLGCSIRSSHLIRGFTPRIPYQLAWCESRQRHEYLRLVRFSGLLAQGLSRHRWTGRTIVAAGGDPAARVGGDLAPVTLPGASQVRVWTNQPDEARQLVAAAVARRLAALAGESGAAIRVAFAGDRASVAWEVGELFGPPAWRAGEVEDGLRRIAAIVIAIRELLELIVVSPPMGERDLDVLFGDRTAVDTVDDGLAALRAMGVDAGRRGGALEIRYEVAGRIRAMFFMSAPFLVLGVSLNGLAAGWPGDGALLGWLASLHPGMGAAVDWLVRWTPWTTFFLVTSPVTGAMGAQRMPRHVAISEREVRVTPGLWPRVLAKPRDPSARIDVSQQVVWLTTGHTRLPISPVLPSAVARQVARTIGGFMGADVALERGDDEA